MSIRLTEPLLIEQFNGLIMEVVDRNTGGLETGDKMREEIWSLIQHHCADMLDERPIESVHALEHHLGQRAAEAIREALRGIEKHGPYNSFHEGYAVMLEEVDELWDEIKQKDADPAAIYLESLQIAAVALRVAVAAQRRTSGR